MIARLVGKVFKINGHQAILDVGGVGYEIYCSGALLAILKEGLEAGVVIYTDVREDAIRLFGFVDELEKQVFLLLQKVKGVGAKSAAEIVSKIDKRDLLRIIANEETQRLQAVKGIGGKTASRIILELKDKVGKYVFEGMNRAMDSIANQDANGMEEAELGSIALGFSRNDVALALSKVVKSGFASKDSGELIKEALRFV